MGVVKDVGLENTGDNEAIDETDDNSDSSDIKIKPLLVIDLQLVQIWISNED